MFKLDLEKAEEPEIKLPTSIGSQKKQAVVAAKSLQLCPTLCNPIDGSPPGSPIPWDSPVKNIVVGCHFLLQCMKVKSESEVAQSCLTQQHHGLHLPGSSINGTFQARVLEGCHGLLWIKQECSRKTSTSDLLTMPKTLTVCITTNCGKFFKKWE